MAARVVVSRSEAVLAQIVVDLADSLGEEIDPGYRVIANEGTVAGREQGQPVPAPSREGAPSHLPTARVSRSCLGYVSRRVRSRRRLGSAWLSRSWVTIS